MILPPILFDLESTSEAKLSGPSGVGGRRYWDHPSTRLVCAVMHDAHTGERSTWVPGNNPPSGVHDRVWAAHNMMGFDRFGAAKEWGMRVDAHDRMIDTAELARRAGLPGSLDALGTQWLGMPKDQAGHRVIMALSGSPVTGDKIDKITSEVLSKGVPEHLQGMLRRYNRERKKAIDDDTTRPEVPPEVLDFVVQYCHNDVDILEHGWPLLAPWLEYEPEVSAADRAVNERGIPVDLPLVRRLLEEDVRIGKAEVRRCARKLGWTEDETRETANSPAQFKECTGAPDAQKDTVQKLKESSGDPCIVALCEARQALASIASGKLKACLRYVSNDGRIRDAQKYCGAHTWRWSGQGVQFQNMPRPDGMYEEWEPQQIDDLAKEVLNGKRCNKKELYLLLRAVVCAGPGNMLVVSDLSGIEARVLAWCADDKVALRTLEQGLDSYKVAASGIYAVPYDEVDKVQRATGKVAELACGYQGGHRALESMAKTLGVDLSNATSTPRQIVAAWREQHKAIVKFWADVDQAWASAARGTASTVGVFEFVPGEEEGDGVAVFLPSGRPVVYTGARIERREKFNKLRDVLVFNGGKTGTEETYGGKIAENLIQALAREFIARALVAAENAGLDPIMHVHDEIVGEVPSNAAPLALEMLDAALLDLPDWAEGFPIGCDGYISSRYKK